MDAVDDAVFFDDSSESEDSWVAGNSDEESSDNDVDGAGDQNNLLCTLFSPILFNWLFRMRKNNVDLNFW